jgi:cytoskeletal protein CcmA (bactofilin family)
MFALRRRGTVIDEGLKIVGSVTAEGLVEVNGHIEGDLHCTSLLISPKAHVSGAIIAERVIVNGSVAGPIQGGDVILKSQAHVVGDIQHKSLSIETGAYFVGRSMQAGSSNGHHPKSVDVAPPREWATNARGIVAAAE